MIRIVLLVYIFLFGCSLGFAQRMEAKSLNRDILVGMGNPIKYSINLQYDSVNFSTTQGVCVKDGDIVTIIPDRPDKDTLYAKFYSKGDITHLDTAIFDVVRPRVFVAFGGEVLRKVKSSTLKIMGGIIFYITVNDFHWEPVTIESYRFSILRDSKVIFSKVESSNRYSVELTAHLNLLEAKDLILISEARLTARMASIANILPCVFEIE